MHEKIYFYLVTQFCSLYHVYDLYFANISFFIFRFMQLKPVKWLCMYVLLITTLLNSYFISSFIYISFPALNYTSFKWIFYFPSSHTLIYSFFPVLSYTGFILGY